MLQQAMPIQAPLIDTCHSGEVDEDVQYTAPAPGGSNESRVVVASDFRGLEYKSGLKASDATHELLGQLFADLRRGSGATVISSASGVEFALESDEWKNGVFTYAVLAGLRGRKADANEDGTVQVSELRDFVTTEVQRRTQGVQTPTSRRENLEFDFSVF